MEMTFAAHARQSFALWQKLYRLLHFSSRNLSILVVVLLVIEVVFGVALLYFVSSWSMSSPNNSEWRAGLLIRHRYSSISV